MHCVVAVWGNGRNGGKRDTYATEQQERQRSAVPLPLSLSDSVQTVCVSVAICCLRSAVTGWRPHGGDYVPSIQGHIVLVRKAIDETTAMITVMIFTVRTF